MGTNRRSVQKNQRKVVSGRHAGTRSVLVFRQLYGSDLSKQGERFKGVG